MRQTCRAASLQALLRDPRLANGPAQEIIDAYVDYAFKDSRGTRLRDAIAFTKRGLHGTRKPREEQLSRPGHATISKWFSTQGYILTDRNVQCHKEIFIEGVRYRTSQSSARDSNVYVRLGDQYGAGQLQNIFECRVTKDGRTFESRTVLHGFLLRSLSPEHADLDFYRRYRIQGGLLFYATQDTSVLLNPQDIVCHFARTARSHPVIGECVHVLPLNRVSVVYTTEECAY